MGGIIPAPAKQLVRTADGSELVIGGDAATSTALFGVDGAAEFRPITLTNKGNLGDPNAAVSAVLDGLRQAGVDTSMIPDWHKGFNFPPVTGSGSDIGTGWATSYNGVGPVLNGYVPGAKIAPAALDPMGTGGTPQRFLVYVTGHDQKPWATDEGSYFNVEIDMLDAGGAKYKIGPFLASTYNRRFGQQIMIGPLTGMGALTDHTVMQTRIYLPGASVPLDWDYQP